MKLTVHKLHHVYVVQYHYNYPLILVFIIQEVSIGKKALAIKGNSPVCYQCNSYGFNIIVEPDTLLPNESCDIIVEPLICGQFEFPDNSIIVSGIYDVSLSGDKLRKAITLEIQHCVDLKTDEQCKSMQFMVAERSDGSPHCFKPVCGGKFFPFLQYGKIKRREFSLLVTKMSKHDEVMCNHL